MPSADLSLPSRRDPVVRRVVASWRRLTGGAGVRDEDRRTLLACSGGADSSALVLAIATVSPAPAVAHVVHDMRPAEEAEADRDRVRELCDVLGLGFVEGRADVAGEPGNTEANARRARYRALASLAGGAGLGWVATGHHADDQLETVLMRLLRGAGVRGLGGILPSRPIGGEGDGSGVRVVRPMLGITRNEAVELCRRCGWVWAEDRTNRECSRRRAAIRERVLPALREIEPNAARATGRSVSSVRSAHRAIIDRVRACEDRAEHTDESIRFARADLRSESAAVLAELLTRLHCSKHGGNRQDRLGQQVLSTCIGVIIDNDGGTRTLDVAGLKVVVSRSKVEFS